MAGSKVSFSAPKNLASLYLNLFGNPLGDTVAKTPENCPTTSANGALNTWCGYADPR